MIRTLQTVALHCALLAFASAPADAGEDTALDPEAIGRAAGVEATVTADGVVRIAWSRDDVAVTIEGLAFPAAAGLGSWAAFKALPDGRVMVMGDTVVFEDEITPAMDAAFANGLEVTSLHNHFVFDRPPAFFMHVGGHDDDAARLASGVHAMWNSIRRVREARKTPAPRSSVNLPEVTGKYDLASLETILGAKGSLQDRVLKFTFERTASMHGVDVAASMGVSTWAAFSGNAGHAVVDGDFAMTADEIQAVMQTLRAAGIHIVALHNHMIGETPPYYFLHYWGNGAPEQLARGLRAALDLQNKR
jgi:hypothetical protein